jgi:glycosyltransferase involved in cell wall biosynthesis
VKLLYFSKSSFIGPSSRYRIYQYIPYLKKAGIDVIVAPLFKEGWFRILDLRQRPLRAAARGLYSLMRFFVRIKDILSVCKYDLYVFEHQAFPYIPTLLERLAHKLNHKMLLEFDDAIYRTFLHKKKIPRLIGMSRHIIVGNNFLRDYAQKFNTHVTVIPTVVDTGRYRPKKDYRLHGKLNIGWIGLAYNLPYVQELAKMLRKSRKEIGEFVLTIISSQRFELDGVEVTFKRWRYDTEVQDIRCLDIGIMPLANDEWAKGKCGLKVLQYMACGVPVVASSVGVNCEIINDGENGFLAATDEEWLGKLALLAHDESLRRRLGQKGRETVEKHYSLRIWGPRITRLYKSLT